MASTIAVIDDDAAYIRFIEHALGGTAYTPCAITTFDPGEALSVMTSAGCDAALVDVFMYDAPAGLAFVEAIRAHPPFSALPVIVASGAHTRLQQASGYLREQHCAVLPKPFGVDDLLAALDAALAPPALAPEAAVRAPVLVPQTLTGIRL